MENKHIIPGEIPPPETRIAIYEKARDRIRTGNFHPGTVGFALCILLPCILWDLRTPHQVAPNGKTWRIWESQLMFPELKDWFAFRAKNPMHERSFNEMRIIHLTEAINKLKELEVTV